MGDVIEAQGHIGVVKEIQLFTTTLLTADGKRVILPNGPVSNGTIVNITVEGTRRVDLVVGVSYSADVDKARHLLLEQLMSNEKVLKDPPPTVEVLELADSSVNLAVRPYVKTADYWDVYFQTLDSAKKTLDQAGISIPFPQRDVHVFEHKS